jgi:putative ABC transport system substrate-binding protein
MPRLGYISPGDIPKYDIAFLKGLEENGYILPGEIPQYDAESWKRLLKQGYFEGKRIRIEIRATGQHLERAPKLATELVSINVDVIYVVLGELVNAVRDATQKANKPIPIVFAISYDPVGFGLVQSLARPGGNMTGVANVDPEFYAKHLEILKEAFPHLARVAYLTNPAWDRKYFLRSVPAMEAAARMLSVKLETFEADTVQDLDAALAEVVRKRIQAIVLPASPLLFANRARVIDFAAKHRLPAIYGDALWVQEGGLMFYGSSVADQKRRSAALVAKVLNGANPADIPVEQPTIYKLVINIKTARTLGFTIPNKVLSRADELIQ